MRLCLPKISFCGRKCMKFKLTYTISFFNTAHYKHIKSNNKKPVFPSRTLQYTTFKLIGLSLTTPLKTFSFPNFLFPITNLGQIDECFYVK